MSDTFRLYSDLAWLWPLWGNAAAEYADYSAQVMTLLRAHARRAPTCLLNIGCGGGKNMHHLKRECSVVGLDLSPQMLAQARALNPECRFVQADMRSFALGERFDAVLMDDAIAHMHTRADFAAAFRAAYAHLQPGGVMVVTPDATAESFVQNRTTSYAAAAEGVEVVFVENQYDPDPTDEHYETTLVYLIRERGRLRTEQDRWRLGLYDLPTWRAVLRGVGFELYEHPYRLDGQDYTMFACVRPG